MTEPATLVEHDEEQPDRHCGGINKRGEACTVPPEMLLFDEESAAWWCVGHHPDPAIQEQRKAAAMRGSMRSKMRLSRRLQRLDPGELGRLETVADAQRQLAMLTEAVATGRLSPTQGNAASRAVIAWIRARDLSVRESRLAKLEQEVERLRRER